MQTGLTPSSAAAVSLPEQVVNASWASGSTHWEGPVEGAAPALAQAASLGESSDDPVKGSPSLSQPVAIVHAGPKANDPSKKDSAPPLAQRSPAPLQGRDLIQLLRSHEICAEPSE
eukprot:CAMPEP_0170577152 /NCGR_PEP_ID=MMETSP0224-20130122/4772_1 /TAXON_ID=285029 /ORGANISM="Togula jolla, Strain CCCM 725" /LENGTH=115 /DNA_ID=CAMNT_0010900039 /DNA_START=315 /DNA_END=663 /DNA_ORIENTATION=-